MFRKAQLSFNPPKSAGFSAVPCGEGAAQSLDDCPSCGSGFVCFLAGYDYCGACGLSFNFWPHPINSPAQRVRS